MAGGAILGLIASTWGYIKAVVWRIFSLFIQRIEIPTPAAHDAITAYLVKNYRRSRNYDRIYAAGWEFQRDGRFGLIPYEQFGQRPLIFWNGWFPFVFSRTIEKASEAEAGYRPNRVSGYLMFFRGTLKVEEIFVNACADRNAISWAAEELDEKSKQRFVLHYVPKVNSEFDDDDDFGNSGLAWYQDGTYRLLAHKPDQLGKRPTSNGKALDNLVFPERVRNLIREIELWRKSRDWYRGKGIPWKRGWLLYGPPGTGKTALARSFAEDLNMPVYVYNLAELGNIELMRAWIDMQVNVPCIALIEDIDNVFHGRENIVRKSVGMPLILTQPKADDGDDSSSQPSRPHTPLTFDCLLNCLDGVGRSDGIFTIITTNDITKIDPALGKPRILPNGVTEFISTRPGRIDKAIELGYMEPKEKRHLAQRMLATYPNELQNLLDFIENNPDLQETPAQFQERCAQIALRRYWDDQSAPAVVSKPGSTVRPIDVNADSAWLDAVGDQSVCPPHKIL